ncbi:tRNA (adenine(22)-N(1))-methyltransferase [Vibrio profundi]|uniref:tRNA (adenine(22)-N(1))-methyltransferase n=1 Tax=Vibrio profundi TaxID=1774960 RepID=UPI00373599E1
MKLGKRLSKIESMVSTEYDQIWDCCCDHGFLGVNLLAANKSSVVHFVDIVPSLMNKLEEKLQRFFPQTHLSEKQPDSSESSATSRWETHCMNVAELPLAAHSGRHLIIIAGVGGDLTLDLVRDIQSSNPGLALDFLLCPVHQHHMVREGLDRLNHGLIKECLVEENRRIYEIILSTYHPEKAVNHTPIHPVGSQIWQAYNDLEHSVAKRYLEKTIEHYQRVNQGRKSNEILNAYRSVSIQFSEMKICESN